MCIFICIIVQVIVIRANGYDVGLNRVGLGVGFKKKT
jgi:hypothetical protein